MLQILQNLGNGMTSMVTVPSAEPGSGQLSIRTRVSLISAGTERMLLDFGKAGWIAKARQQPDKVRMVLEKVRTDGIASTIEAVRAKLDQPVALGYSNAGVVIETGSGVAELKPGERVVSNGSHAEIVRVPKNLCARIPDSVSDEAASFAVVGAIALQGIRLVAPTLGETVVVTGLGLIGLLTVQLLRAHGCRVIGLDFDERKLALATQFGVETVNLAKGEDPVSSVLHYTHGRGADAVIITAATKSNEPVHQAALMCRKRGRIVLVGVAGLELSRDDFYKKELSFQVSCSYGPGRYDAAYEQGGQDYPFPFVRWTAQRNFEAVLEMMADGRVSVEPLITHRFQFDRALEAYDLIQSDAPHLGVLLEYPAAEARPEALLRSRTIPISPQPTHKAIPAAPVVAVIGAGGYALKVLIPAFAKAGVRLAIIASSGGLSASHVARKFGFEQATTDLDTIFASPEIDTVVIATRHDSHSRLVCRALAAGKHVFVEKPLALTLSEIDEIENAWGNASPKPMLSVGFNRRFAPHVIRMKELLAGTKGPKAFIYTVNAGSLPSDHWTLDPQSGGGRIAGEACHFVDLIRHLAGSPLASIRATALSAETVSLSVSCEDGSIGAIHYFANGDKAFPKERLEVFCDGKILQLDNFRKLKGFGWSGFSSFKLWRQDKGADACVRAFVDALRTGGPGPIPFDEIIQVSRCTLEAALAAL